MQAVQEFPEARVVSDVEYLKAIPGKSAVDEFPAEIETLKTIRAVGRQGRAMRRDSLEGAADPHAARHP